MQTIVEFTIKVGIHEGEVDLDELAYSIEDTIERRRQQIGLTQDSDEGYVAWVDVKHYGFVHE